MANRAKSIELMNQSIAEEMLALNQYMYFHFVCEDAGYAPLAAYFKRTAIVEMIHVEKFAERILFLKGKVEMKQAGAVQQIDDPAAMLAEGVRLETATIDAYNARARACSEAGDAGTKDLFEAILLEEEGHQDAFDTELTNIRQFGDTYLALQASEHSKELAGK